MPFIILSFAAYLIGMPLLSSFVHFQGLAEVLPTPQKTLTTFCAQSSFYKSHLEIFVES